jgi:hypothetical protein
MGLVLVGGFAFVLAAIVYQASHPRQAAINAVPTLGPEPAATLDLPVTGDAGVSAMSLDGNRLALQLNSSAGPEIVIIDLASGRVVARVRLKPQ